LPNCSLKCATSKRSAYARMKAGKNFDSIAWKAKYRLHQRIPGPLRKKHARIFEPEHKLDFRLNHSVSASFLFPTLPPIRPIVRLANSRSLPPRELGTLPEHRRIVYIPCMRAA
jgi:hypothetical protein